MHKYLYKRDSYGGTPDYSRPEQRAPSWRLGGHMLSREPHDHQHRQMIGDTAGVARAQIGAQGLVAGVGRIAGKEEGNAEDAQGRGPGRKIH